MCGKLENLQCRLAAENFNFWIEYLAIGAFFPQHHFNL
jgi:hypothetical protein